MSAGSPGSGEQDVVERIAAVIVAHQRIPMYGHIPMAQRCVGCDNLKGASDGPNSPRHAHHVAEQITAALGLRGEYAATDITSVELEQWPDHTTTRVSAEAAEDEFVHDGDDVLLRRFVSDWRPLTPPGERP